MNFSFYIAKKYLFTKTSNNAINIITIIASFGVIVSSLSLFIILSGFSGLRTFSFSLLEALEPDIKISSKNGKYFTYTKDIQGVLQKNKNISAFSKVIEERVFLEYNNKYEVAYIKGVEQNYNLVTQIDKSLSLGSWLEAKYPKGVVVGWGISRKLSLSVSNYGEALSILTPKLNSGFLNPYDAFYNVNTQVIGVFSGSEELENKYVYMNIDEVKKLLKLNKNQISSIELKLSDNYDANLTSENLKKQLGSKFKIQTKEQLNEILFKVINTENIVSYLIFTLIIIIALFNVVGAIIMMIIDKKTNLKTLFNLGVTIKKIKKIFVIQGFLLTLSGMAIGLFFGVILIYFQKQYGFFMITQNLPYPVELRIFNLLIVSVTIATLGYLAAKIASSIITGKFIKTINN